MEAKFPVYIKTLGGGFELFVEPNTTVYMLRRLIYQHNPDYRKDMQTLIDFRDTSKPHMVLNDDQTMAGFTAGDEINLWMNQVYRFPTIEMVVQKMKECSLKGIRVFETELGLERGKEYRFLLRSYDYVPIPYQDIRVAYESRQGTHTHTSNPFFHNIISEPYKMGARRELLTGDIFVGTFVKARDTHCTTYDEEKGMVRLVMALVMENVSVYRDGNKIVWGLAGEKIYIQVQYIMTKWV